MNNIINNNWKKDFFTIAIGQAISLVGSSAVSFALIWWIASESGSPMLMAFSGLMSFLPMLVLGPFAGVWIDRLPRKKVIIIADMSMGIIALIFAFTFQKTANPYIAVCMVLFARALGNVFHGPAISALMPLIVPTDQLVRVNGWTQLIQSGSFMLGPVLGAIMFQFLPMPIILLSDFIGAVAASLTMATVTVKELPPSLNENPHFLRELKEGIKVLRTDKKLCSTVITATLCMIFFLPLSSYYPLMSSSYFNLPSIYGSMVEFSYAVGMLISAYIISKVGTIKHKFLTINMGMMGMGITSLICGVLPPNFIYFWIFAVTCSIMGASGNIYGIPLTSYIQENIDPQAQGRVFSLVGSLLSFSMPVGLLISGPLAEKYGTQFWFLVSGIAIILFVISNLLILKKQNSPN